MQLEKILCDKFKYSSFKLAALLSKAPKKYRVYFIPKRNSGTRVIAQPTKELKEIQRFLVTILKEHLHIHSSAMAYKENVSVKHNAFLHKDNPYLLKMDFQNFFNKIKPDFFFSKLDKLSLELDYNDKYILKSFLFWKPGLKRSVTHILSVGAPSSPFISNFVMYDFDKKISEWCKGYDITYSRYADDITFSTKRKGLLFSIPKVVKVMLAQHAMGITINESKTIFTSKKHNRHVTGVTLTSENKLSVGRKKKKHISSLIYKYSLGELNDEEVLHAKGLLSYCIHIERDFLNRMKVKYGSEVINRFLKEGCDE